MLRENDEYLDSVSTNAKSVMSEMDEEICGIEQILEECRKLEDSYQKTVNKKKDEVKEFYKKE